MNLIKYARQQIASILNRRNRQFALMYDTVVKSGTVHLQPVNGNCMTIKLPAKSHIARRIISKGSYEQELTSYLSKLAPLGDFVNVGANVGFFSTYSAQLLANDSKVLAIEPNPNAHMLLVENTKINNQQEKVIIENCAIGNQEGKGSLTFIKDKPEYSSLANTLVHPSAKHNETHKVTVDIIPLDKLISKHDLKPTLLLIDVEGAEELVLQSAIETITQHRPVIIFECSDQLLSEFDTDHKSIFSLLEKLGYICKITHNTSAQKGCIEGEVIATHIRK